MSEELNDAVLTPTQALIMVRNARVHLLVGRSLDEPLRDAARRLNATHSSLAREIVRATMDKGEPWET